MRQREAAVEDPNIWREKKRREGSCWGGCSVNTGRLSGEAFRALGTEKGSLGNGGQHLSQ